MDFGKTMSYVKDISYQFGLGVKSQLKGYAQLIATTKESNVSLKDSNDIYEGVSTAIAALQLSADDAWGAIRAVVQIMSKGKVQAEELRGQLGERIPGAFQIAAKAMGVTTKQLDEQMRLGELYAEDFLPKFGRAMKEHFGLAAQEASKSVGASINRLQNAIFNFLERVGESGAWNDLTELFDEIRKSFEDKEFIENFVESFKEMTKFISKAISEVFKYIPDILYLIQKSFKFLNENFDEFAKIIKLIITIKIISFLGGIASALWSVGNALKFAGVAGWQFRAALAAIGLTYYGISKAQEKYTEYQEKSNQQSKKAEETGVGTPGWQSPDYQRVLSGDIIGGDRYQAYLDRYKNLLKDIERATELAREEWFKINSKWDDLELQRARKWIKQIYKINVEDYWENRERPRFTQAAASAERETKRFISLEENRLKLLKEGNAKQKLDAAKIELNNELIIAEQRAEREKYSQTQLEELRNIFRQRDIQLQENYNETISKERKQNLDAIKDMEMSYYTAIGLDQIAQIKQIEKRYDDLRSKITSKDSGLSASEQSEELAKLEKRKAEEIRFANIEIIESVREVERQYDESMRNIQQSIRESIRTLEDMKMKTREMGEDIQKEKESRMLILTGSGQAKLEREQELRAQQIAFEAQMKELDRQREEMILKLGENARAIYDLAEQQKRPLSEMEEGQIKILVDNHNKKVAELEKQTEELKRLNSERVNSIMSKEQLENMKRGAEFFADNFTDAFDEVMRGTKNLKDAFKDMVYSILTDLAKLAAKQAILGAFQAAMGGSGGTGGALATILGAAGGLMRQSGGPVRAGNPYVVGEAGPELFIPNSDGRIKSNAHYNMAMNNQDGSGGMNITVNMNNPVSTADDAKMKGQIIAREIKAQIDRRIMFQRKPGGILNPQPVM